MADKKAPTKYHAIGILHVLQGCPNQFKWIESKMELRATSVSLFWECWENSSLALSVSHDTPENILWNPRGMRISPRVAGVRPVRLCWSANPVTFVGIKCSELLEKVNWSDCLKELVFAGPCSNVASFKWPKSLEVLKFTWVEFDAPLSEVVWPDTLTSLYLCGSFNHPIIDVNFPSSLVTLELGCFFEQSLDGVLFPDAVEVLVIGSRFDDPIEDVEWPKFLKKLRFLSGLLSFNQPLSEVVFPDSLEVLELPDSYNSDIAGVEWPGLKRVELGDDFNKPIVGVDWPSSVERLEFGNSFNQSIVDVEWPSCLSELKFGGSFNTPIVGVKWPKSLKRLEFGDQFNQPVVDVVFPRLKELSFGRYFQQSVEDLKFPDSLDIVVLGSIEDLH